MSRHLLLFAAALLVSGCLETPAERGGLSIASTGCFLDESGTPRLECAEGSIELQFDTSDDVVDPGPPIALADELDGIVGCTLQCLLEECPACPLYDSDDDVPTDDEGSDAVMVIRDPDGYEIERVALGALPTSVEALAVLDVGVESAASYAQSELEDGPISLTTDVGFDDPLDGAAGALRMMNPCAGVTVEGTVKTDEQGSSFNGTIVVDQGSAEAKPAGEARVLETVSYLGGVLLSKLKNWQCAGATSGAPPVLATASSMPGGGAILAALMSIAPGLVPAVMRQAQGVTQRALPIVNLRPFETLSRLGTSALNSNLRLTVTRFFQTDGYLRIADSGRTMVVQRIQLIREVARQITPSVDRLHARELEEMTLENWQRVRPENKLKVLIDLVQNLGADREGWTAVEYHTGQLLGRIHVVEQRWGIEYTFFDELGRALVY